MSVNVLHGEGMRACTYVEAFSGLSVVVPAS